MKHAVLLIVFAVAFGDTAKSLAQTNSGGDEYPRPQLVRKKWQRLSGTPACTAGRCRQRIVLSNPQRGQGVLLHLNEPANVLVNDTLPVSRVNTGVDVTYQLPAAAEQDLTIQGPAASRLLATAWLEIVPAIYIKRLIADTVPTGEALNVTVFTNTPDLVEAELRDGSTVVASSKGNSGERIWLKPENPRYWSPSDPFLYQLHVKLSTGDEADSYAAMRTIGVTKDAAGIPRILLNGQPFFSYGLLTNFPANPAALLRMGFNTVRQQALQSHRWYAACDRAGLLVWQDLPTASAPSPQRLDAVLAVESLRAHPSIAVWTLFDEGKGQEAFGLDAARTLAGEIVRLDPARLVNGASGWFDTANGHLHDLHFTPGPGMFVIGQRRAAVLGKFGELQADTRGELRRLYRELMGKLSLYRAMGLTAAIYAPPAGQSLSQQLGEEWLATINRRMLDNRPQVETLAGGEEPFDFTVAEPGAAREGWRAGSGIVGKALRNIQPGIPWTTPAIRLRHTFGWKGASEDVYLVHWATRGAILDVKLNGTTIATANGQGGESPQFLQLKGNPALRNGDNQITVDARRSGPDAAFEVRLIAVTGDKLGFADPEITQRSEYPLVAIDNGRADLARFASQFTLVRSRRGRPAGVSRTIPFIRELPVTATPEQLYYALLSARDDGFNGATISVQAATESERIESELKIRNMQEWVNQYTKSFPTLHATGLGAFAFARKPANAALLFTPTPEKPRPPDAVWLASFPGSADAWLENLRLLTRAAQSHWPLIPESDGGLFAYASFLLGVEPRTVDSLTRLAVPLGELEPHFFWHIGGPAESLPPSDIERYKVPDSTIYRRRFTNGLVAVNPGPQTQTLRLDNALMDAATRQVLSAVELPAGSAKILIRPGTTVVTQ